MRRAAVRAADRRAQRAAPRASRATRAGRAAATAGCRAPRTPRRPWIRAAGARSTRAATGARRRSRRRAEIARAHVYLRPRAIGARREAAGSARGAPGDSISVPLREGVHSELRERPHPDHEGALVQLEPRRVIGCGLGQRETRRIDPEEDEHAGHPFLEARKVLGAGPRQGADHALAPRNTFERWSDALREIGVVPGDRIAL